MNSGNARGTEPAHLVGMVDVHSHIGRTVALEMSHSYQDSVAAMTNSGIGQAILSPMSGGRQAAGVHDTMRENDAIAEAMRRRPDHFPVGLAGVEVRHEELALEELQRCFDCLSLSGVSLHAMFSGFSVGTGRVLDPILDLVNSYDGLCLMHVMPEWGDFSMESPRAVGQLAARYPRVTFILGHAAITTDQRAISIEAAYGRDNVFVDLAFQELTDTVETFVRTLGPERVLFGSDTPFRDPRPTIESVLRARISESAKERILRLNGCELLTRYRRLQGHT